MGMRNWVEFEYGYWINGAKWERHGTVSIDPSSIVAVVQDCRIGSNNDGTTIYLAGRAGSFTVSKTRQQVIDIIQTALLLET